jgi:hypothetical protein
MFFDPDPLVYAQIAATFGITEGSIGPTRGRCLQKLRALLEKQGFYSGEEDDRTRQMLTTENARD